MSDDKAATPRLNPALKFALEMGPLILFFATYSTFGIFPATGVLMAGVVSAIAITYAITRHVPVMPLVTAVLVLVFGGLTFLFNDSTFIKLKATIIYCLFGTALLGGLAMGKLLLPIVLDSVLQLTEEGWRKLTIRWGFFFFGLAILNEIIWRTQTEAFWVKFKVFGFVPLTMVFALAQIPLILRHERKPESTADEPEHL